MMITTTTTSSNRNRLVSSTTKTKLATTILCNNNTNSLLPKRRRSVIILLSTLFLLLILCNNQIIDDYDATILLVVLSPTLFCYGFPITQQISNRKATKSKKIMTFLHSTTSNNVNNKNDNNNPQRQIQISRRWNGNYKHSNKKLCDVPKRKKLQLELQVQGGKNEQMYKKTFIKTKEETLQHVLTKAMIWALFVDEYPNLQVEYDIGDPNYLPDVVSFVTTTSDSDNDDDDDITTTSVSSSLQQKQPLFWGESGRMKVSKAVNILQRYPNTHFVHCRWGMPNGIDSVTQPLEEYLQEQFDLDLLDLRAIQRTAKFEFCHIPYDVWRFIDETTIPMTINITKHDLQWKQLQLPSTKNI